MSKSSADLRWWQEFGGVKWWDLDSLLLIAVAVLIHRIWRLARRRRARA